MAKCDLCKAPLQELFLKKIKGTIIRKPDTKKTYSICPSCQKKFSTRDDILKQL